MIINGIAALPFVRSYLHLFALLPSSLGVLAVALIPSLSLYLPLPLSLTLGPLPLVLSLFLFLFPFKIC